MSINFIFGLIIAMVIGTIVSYLVIQGADFLIRYIRKRNHCQKNTYLKDWRIVDFDPDIPAVQINAEEFTDDEVVLDARDWCKEDDRIVFIMVKTQDKANLVTKNGVRDATDIYTQGLRITESINELGYDPNAEYDINDDPNFSDMGDCDD